jgi:hypothetical protein
VLQVSLNAQGNTNRQASDAEERIEKQIVEGWKTNCLIIYKDHPQRCEVTPPTCMINGEC